ncbi:general secretion pathway protein GspB [Hahella sp. SMD15-11]|uniref:General secretion pathway protein GspB n=1 Tax=Thermohahella caldifontis TaxID=3142973 RepID=A0AB39UVB9_9GAMM
MRRWIVFVVMWMGIAGAGAAESDLGDPTRPAGWMAAKTQPVRLPHLAVRSVVYSGASRFAVINGKVVREGQSVSGARVLSIRPGKVKLNYKGHTFWRQVASVNDVKKR